MNGDTSIDKEMILGHRMYMDSEFTIKITEHDMNSIELNSKRYAEETYGLFRAFSRGEQQVEKVRLSRLTSK